MDMTDAHGMDFVEPITRTVRGSRVVLVVDGPRWATLSDSYDRPRFADPDDRVRLEIETNAH